MNRKYVAASIAFAIVSAGSAAHAQSAGNLLGAPITAVGNAVTGVGVAHAGIAPTVNNVSPTVEPATDGVTNAIVAAGTGISGTGQQASASGLRVGTTASGRPLVSVGTTNPNQQGSVAAVLNAHP